MNIARGDVVDEAALADALAAGRLRGAALDVFTTEPPPESSPFWDLPNVLVSPHSASTVAEENDRIVEIFCENLQAYLAGRPLRTCSTPTCSTDRDRLSRTSDERDRLVTLGIGREVSHPTRRRAGASTPTAGRSSCRAWRASVTTSASAAPSSRWAADHLEAAVSAGGTGPPPDAALQFLACVGNPVRVLTGPGGGRRRDGGRKARVRAHRLPAADARPARPRRPAPRPRARPGAAPARLPRRGAPQLQPGARSTPSPCASATARSRSRRRRDPGLPDGRRHRDELRVGELRRDADPAATPWPTSASRTCGSATSSR